MQLDAYRPDLMGTPLAQLTGDETSHIFFLIIGFGIGCGLASASGVGCQHEDTL